MPEASDERSSNEDIKAKMRAALERKRSTTHPADGTDAGRRGEKAHGPEVAGGATPRMHRRKAGGGGA